MSEATQEAASSSNGEAAKEEAAPETETKKAPKRRAIFVMVPADIEDISLTDPPVPPSPEPDKDGKKPKVQAVEMTSQYHMYAVPAGPGQKAAIRSILKKHNVDLRTIGRVRMFAREKPFEVETQYNIRF